MLERAQILAENFTITLDDLPENMLASMPVGGPAPPPDANCLREVERRHVQEILLREKGNKVHAARVLGISRRCALSLDSKASFEGQRRVSRSLILCVLVGVMETLYRFAAQWQSLAAYPNRCLIASATVCGYKCR